MAPSSPVPRRRSRLFIAFTVLLAVAIGAYAFVHLGRFMAREDPLQKSDAIFVFAGTRIERPLEAADLYREGWAPRIVITRAVAEQATFSLEHRGVRIATDFDVNREVLLKVGVPESALIEPDRIHDNTAEEVRTLRELTVRNRWRRVILVSSFYHLRRIRLATWKALRGTDVQLVLHGSRYDPSLPDRWWRHRSDARFVLVEVLKLAGYAIDLGD